MPKADEAQKSKVDTKLMIPLVIKSKDMIFLERQKISVRNLPDMLGRKHSDPSSITIQIRADENVAYDVIKEVMLELAKGHINKIEFSTWKEQPEPL